MGLREILAEAARTAEAILKHELRRGGFLSRMYFASITPLSINVSTDLGEAHVSVSEGGEISVSDGLRPSPDVTVEAEYSELEALINSPDGARLARAEGAGKIRFVPHTAKGRAAVPSLRRVLGG